MLLKMLSQEALMVLLTNPQEVEKMLKLVLMVYDPRTPLERAFREAVFDPQNDVEVQLQNSFLLALKKLFRGCGRADCPACGSTTAAPESPAAGAAEEAGATTPTRRPRQALDDAPAQPVFSRALTATPTRRPRQASDNAPLKPKLTRSHTAP